MYWQHGQLVQLQLGKSCPFFYRYDRKIFILATPSTMASIGNIMRLECRLIISALFAIGEKCHFFSVRSHLNEDIEMRDLWTKFIVDTNGKRVIGFFHLFHVPLLRMYFFF